jgi:hypothetical protein
MKTARLIGGVAAAILLLAGMLASPGLSRADQGWPHRAGGTLNDYTRAVAVDEEGYIYLAGSFSGTASFGGTSLTSAGGTDFWLGKMSPGGSWEWVVRGGGTGDDEALAVAVDSDVDNDSRSVYVAGRYNSSDAKVGTSSLHYTAGYEAFVAKFLANGAAVWAASATGTGDDEIRGVAVNEDGEVFVAGSFSDTLSLRKTSIQLSHMTKAAAAACTAVPGNSWDYCYTDGTHCGPCEENLGDCDGSGQCKDGLVCVEDLNLPGFPSALWDICQWPAGVPRQDTDFFVAKLTSAGEWRWGRSGGGEHTLYPNRLSRDAATGIAVKKDTSNPDQSKNLIYVTGHFEEDLKVYNVLGTTYTLAHTVTSPNGKRDLFVAKLVERGSSILDPMVPPTANPTWSWVTDSTHGTTGDELLARGIARDEEGYLYVTGSYKGTPSLTSQALPASGTATWGFLGRLVDGEANASWQWSQAIGGNLASQPMEATAVSADRLAATDKGVYVAGHFSQWVDFYQGSTAATRLAAPGQGQNVFVARYLATTGDLDWAVRGGLYGTSQATAMVSDSSGTTFLGGHFLESTSLIESQVMSFDGVSQRVWGPMAVSESSFSVSLWFRTTDPNAGIFSVTNTAETLADRYLCLSGGNLKAGLINTLGNESIETTGSNLADGQWHHAVYTFRSTAPAMAHRLYLDGVEQVAGTRTSSTFTADNGIRIGYAAAAGHPYFKGKIANLQVGNYLDAATVLTHFANEPDADSSGKLLFSAGGNDVFAASLTSNGMWRESQAWVVGQAVPFPPGAVPMQPEVISPSNHTDYFFWSEYEKKLYAIWPVGSLIRWRVSTDLLDTARVTSVGAAEWPEEPQRHVAGVPVDVQPPTTAYTFAAMMRTETNAPDPNQSTTSTRIFDPGTAGYTVLRYGLGGVDSSKYPVDFQVVLTKYWDDSSILADSAPCTLGTRITDYIHNDPEGRNGWVFFQNSYYDGNPDNPNRAYDRATRSGPIIPVNRNVNPRLATRHTPVASGTDMVVVWYENNFKNIPWPVRPVRYDCVWPTSPARIIIASQLGSDILGQPPLDPLIFQEAHVYRQADKAKPGYNPNEEHASLFPSATGSGYDALFALRNDLHNSLTKVPSEPFVLLKYRSTADQQWTMKVYKVERTGAGYDSFRYSGVAASPIFPPYPVRLLNPCAESTGEGAWWKDRVNNQYWARAQGAIKAWYYYPLLAGFDYAGSATLPESFTGVQNDCVPWLDRRAGTDGKPIQVDYDIIWPPSAPVLQVGETLLASKRGLPDIMNQAAVEVIYDQLDPDETDPDVGLVQIIEPLIARKVSLATLPGEIETRSVDGKHYLTQLPFHLSQRVYYDPVNKKLAFKGYFDDTVMGDPLFMLNVMGKADREELYALSTNAAWRTAVDNLFYLTRNPRGVDRPPRGAADLIEPGETTYIGLQDANNDGVPESFQGAGPGLALTAGAATGTGFVTVAFNNDPALGGLPVSLQVIRVECGPYLGEIKVIEPESFFDEKLTLRHSGDFGGNPERFTFEWYYHPDQDGTSPSPPPSPETSMLYGWLPFAAPDGGVGASSITIRGATLQTMSDNWFYVRYRGYPVCGNATTPTPWAGAPGSTALEPKAQLAEGWVKRVVRGLNPFEARVRDFRAAPIATYVSMIRQAGERYEGDVAMNSNPDNLNSMGLIEAYETVLRRGMTLSIDSTPPINYEPANAALLLAASRISDLYMLLGNEAFGDAADPTIGFTTQSGEVVGGDFGSAAPTIYAFMNQTASLLEEELTLLRGRDDSGARPVYNRLVWNFTSGYGEVAYANVYGIDDQNYDGLINEYDGRVLFPQGHGDAWGHYLSALTVYYRLLRHPYYSWNPRPEAVLVAGAPVQVDYLDERNFAKAAAAKARAGSEVVDLTYRNAYVDDAEGQWQGYKDADASRAWGLSEWARRAGQGAYFDWVTATSLIRARDPDPSHEGISKIDRTTVTDLGEITAQFRSVQAQLDKADAGLNPLGLAKGVVPFDIDPGEDTATHFEQIGERAKAALNNLETVFNYANHMTQSLRTNQDALEEFVENISFQELDYKNRLIEIFGYPYEGDLGPAGSYDADYDGPDLLHYMWVDSNGLTTGTAPVPADKTVTVSLDTSLLDYLSRIEGITGSAPVAPTDPTTREVTYRLSADGLGIVPNMTASQLGMRRAQGELQRALYGFYSARARYEQALLAYDNYIRDVNRLIVSIAERYDFDTETVRLKQSNRDTMVTLMAWINGLTTAQIVLKRISAFLDATFKDTSHCIPDVVGFSNALGKPVACAVEIGGSVGAFVLDTIADGMEIAKVWLQHSKEVTALDSEIKLERLGRDYERLTKFRELEALILAEPTQRLNVILVKEETVQAMKQYFSVLASGERLIKQLETFRKVSAGNIQEYRYQDMAFRVFRNNGIQKYRAQFDLAARYVYLAATAYDYETNLMDTSSAAGGRFLTNIVRQRTPGEMVDGSPVIGSEGLAESLGRLEIIFGSLKGQLGLNNPQNETTTFSVRNELFRILDDPDPDLPDLGDNINPPYLLWTDALEASRVDDLWQVPEFRRYCRPFAPEAAGPQPGLVIPFASTVSFRRNFFGWPLGPGDNAFDPTLYSTKIRGLGVWFEGYGEAGLSNTPRVYLIPAGSDFLRPPDSGNFTVRQWQVVDQKLPPPMPVGASDLKELDWIPINDSLLDDLGGIRRFSSFRAYHDGFSEDDLVTDSRLVGRSVWNSRWLLIIPGGTLHYDRNVGLDRFIQNVTDINLVFQTYGWSGN